MAERTRWHGSIRRVAVATIMGWSLTIAGCAGLSSGPAAAPDPATSGFAATNMDDAYQLVRYANDLRALPPAMLAAEHERAEHALRTSPGPTAALRMALLLTVPGAPFADEERARNLLREYASQETASPPQRDLARFLLANLTERPGSPAGAATNGRSNGDAVPVPEVTALRRQLLAERARRDELEKQVEALKRLELNLNERENGAQ